MYELWQTEWCPASRRVRQRLTELGVDYFTRLDPELAMRRIIRQANLSGFTVRFDPLQAPKVPNHKSPQQRYLTIVFGPGPEKGGGSSLGSGGREGVTSPAQAAP